MTNYFEKEFELRYFEMNNFGEASSTTMLTLLEETAADHCYSIDNSLYDLEKQGVGWILLSGVMQMNRYPAYKEKITIRTWLSSYSSIRGIRENIIYDATGEIIGRAKGQWVFFDLEHRKPIRILDVFKERWSYDKQTAIEHDLSRKLSALDDSLPYQKFSVNAFDVDQNNHVSNIRYLQWLIESVPKEITDRYILQCIDGRFISEINFGEHVKSYTQKIENQNAFIHTIRTQGDNRVAATARTVWKLRN